MRTLYFDVACGASGDMILAALVDAGASIERLNTDLGRLAIGGLSVKAERARRSGLACTHLTMAWDEQRSLRHLPDLLGMVAQGSYPARVVERATSVLNRLAQAEAAAHGIEVDRVHFHEIGAADTIVDILGAALCLDYLGIDRIEYSALTVGSGQVKTEHGVMPVPVPAVAWMIRGREIRRLDTGVEILTPTGCAILTALGEQVASVPSGTVSAVGAGGGDRELAGFPNVLRAFVVDTDTQNAGAPEFVCVLESDMDHVSGEVMAFAAEECAAAGALDITWTPVFMKKGRPGYRLTVVCEENLRERLAEIVITQTRTLGVRFSYARRAVARREAASGELLGMPVAEKLCGYGSHAFRKIEYESLASVARATGRPIAEVAEAYVARQP